MLPSRKCIIVLAIFGWIVGLILLPNLYAQEEEVSAAEETPKNNCLVCHSHLGGQLASPTGPFPTDVHAEKGLTCASCHGGDPTSMDAKIAKSPARGYRGRPSRQEVPEFCGRCHSDASYMRQFNPTVKTDEVSQYYTSEHGKRLRQGDLRVATCVNCHSVHDIKLVSDPTSPVYPTNVPATCGKCHSDTDYMQGYDLPNLDQVDNYQKSVHYEALTKEGNLSAPTCQTCHGSHGATPPGVNSVTDICGTCHSHNREFFQGSSHRQAFETFGVPGCIQCHSNHAIHRANETMLVGPNSVCSTCHAPDDNGGQSAEQMAKSIQRLDDSIKKAQETLEQAESAGVDMSEPLSDLSNARTRLVMARTTIHTLDPSRVEDETKEGFRIAGELEEEGKQKLQELRGFRQGLVISSIFIMMAVFGLYLSLRQRERIKPGNP